MKAKIIKIGNSKGIRLPNEIIKEYKGGFNAGFWQTVAYVFGSSLKQQYEPQGEDKEIEKIVLELQKLYGYKG